MWMTSFPGTPALMQLGASFFNTFIDGLAYRCPEVRATTTTTSCDDESLEGAQVISFPGIPALMQLGESFFNTFIVGLAYRRVS
jgi:hypothetical protein